MQPKRAVGFSWLAVAAFLMFAGQLVAGSNRWTRRGPAGGSIIAIAIDPDVATTVYISTHSGIYKTVDGGDTWRSANYGLTDHYVIAIAVSGGDSPTVLAGTWDGLVFRSLDGGDHWTRAGSLPGYVSNFLFEPQGSVYAISSARIARSDDRGETWEVFPQPRGVDGNLRRIDQLIGRSPALYARSGELLYLVTDGGRTVKSIPKIPFGPRTVDVDTAGVMVIGRDNAAAVSKDGGTSWQLLPAIGSRISAIKRYSGGSLVSTSEGIFRLVDGQSSWSRVGDFSASYPYMAVAAFEPERIFAFDWRTETFHRFVESSGEWDTVDAGLMAATTAQVALSTGRVFAATKHGLSRISEGDKAWTDVVLPPDVGPEIRSVSAVSDVLLISTSQGFHKSGDGGTTWTTLTPKSAWASRVAPSDPRIVYAAFADGMSKSTDGGETWASVQNNMPLNYYFAYYGFEASSVLVDPSDPDTVYVCQDAVYRSTDGGARWEEVTVPVRPGLSTIALDPHNPSVLYGATWADTALKSEDAGKTWRRLDIDGRTTSLVVDPSNSSIVYAATAMGQVFRSTTAGAHWTSINTGLSGAAVRSLTIDPTGRHVYAATYGGVFEYERDDSYLAGAVAHTVSLRTYSGTNVSAADCGDTVVVDGPQDVGQCETFTLFDVNGGALMNGDRVYLRASGGNFIAAETGGASACSGCDGVLIANRVVAGAWETFTVERAGADDGAIGDGERIHLRSINGDYVSAEKGGFNAGALRADRSMAGAWETFTLSIR
jgi:photosystem II stability/assembly factor-like uncharacterized protein